MNKSSYKYRNNFRSTILRTLDFNNEIWAFHPRSEYYLISSYGRVKNILKNLILTPQINKKGYKTLRITLIDKEMHSVLVHRLVCETFFGYLDSKNYQVNHIDGNKQNNNASNLEWCTNRENMDHAIANNLRTYLKGDENGFCKFKDKDILDMKEFRQLGYTFTDIAKAYGGSRDYISNLVRGTSDRQLINKGII